MSATSVTSPKLPPPPDQAETTTPRASDHAPTTTSATRQATRPRAGGQCGTVTAASGFTLRVMRGDAGCELAERVVAAFHAEIEGKQPAGSRHPVKATVDGWACVSGPPSSQGGTSCSKGDTDVLAAVITDE